MLKSIFISLYLLAATVITVFAVRSMIVTLDYVSWGTVLAILGYTRSGDALALVLAVLGFISFLIYVYWYSSFGREANTALGKIIWAHETDNYRVRPDPDVYLNVLNEAGILATN